uniref:F-box domain-containing protein n=1 Tax=Strongyloides stercoralis TaxID=6248 RepID=A0A913HV23_STRER
MEEMLIFGEKTKNTEVIIENEKINNILRNLISNGDDIIEVGNDERGKDNKINKDNDNIDNFSSHEGLIKEYILSEIKKSKSILNSLIQNLPTPKDRKNIEVVSKKFYSLSNDPTSYVFLSKSEKISKQFINGELGNYQLIISGNEIIINILESFQFKDDDYNLLQRIMKKYIPIMESLYFMITSPNYYEIFENLNCFDRIKTVKIDVHSLQRSGIRIFKECSLLKPVNIHIKDLALLNNRDIYDSVEYQFPSTVKNIYFESNPEVLEWLLRKVSLFREGYFDNFFMSKYAFTKLMDSNKKNTFSEIIKYFKRISYFNGDFYASPFDINVGNILYKYNIKTIVSIYFSKNNIIKNVLNCPKRLCVFDEIRGSILGKKNCRILEHKGIYSNIDKLIISDVIEARKFHPLSFFEIQFLINDLERMRKLDYLEIDLHLFKTFPDFKKFFSAIKCQIKYLKIGKCSTIMSYYLPEIRRYCEKLEYLYLEDIGPYTTVTIKDVLNTIKSLKGLKIKFNNFYNFKYILESLEKKVGVKSILDWPEIDFLNILCPIPDNDNCEKMRQIEYNTSRKIGKFMIKEIVCNGKIFYQIIVQRSTKLYDQFEEIFDVYF